MSGKPDGVVISEIQPGSLFENVGLVNGDIIQEVNGKPVTGVADLLSLYRELRPGANLSVKVSRTGRQVVLNHRCSDRVKFGGGNLAAVVIRNQEELYAACTVPISS
jgi:S1-C subfamily serine protease